ncbi:TonB-dependent receptor [Pontibacterium granulatum]|uniref:TonB-dependent receptor n=1 Tax=Pontibacterium granulatum TaxID=2036029 RepID=UPI00249C452A|nr:TonB-dependent receptor [Pontibacterium granulatum]MDI3324789.1 TonB-dependent receptor [Pontibacterium granulatum]
MDRKFVLTAFGYAILGLLLGIYMAASGNHGQFVTHAHIMLVGFLLSFLYGLCHKLWLNNSTSRLACVQFYLHQAGAVVLLPGLFLLYGEFLDAETLDPVLAAASITVFMGVVLMSIEFIKCTRDVTDGA